VLFAAEEYLAAVSSPLLGDSEEVKEETKEEVKDEDMGLSPTEEPVVSLQIEAFSLSPQSQVSFEKAIRKPRRKLKHKISRCQARLYGIYLMMAKHHGQPPLE